MTERKFIGAWETRMLGHLLSFVTSLFIGLLIGIERERSHQEGVQPIGVRTFVLFSLLGTLAATLDQIALTIPISLFVFGIIILGYIRSTKIDGRKADIGITTEVAAGLIFCLGYLIVSVHLLAIILSALILLVLLERKRLHVLARRKFKLHTIETSIIFVIFVLGILPLLPDRTIDPWGLFNPHNFSILVTTIAGIQLVGFVAVHLFGERVGVAVSGFLGGLVSSTVVFLNLSSVIKKYPTFNRAIMASALLAHLAMLVEIIAIIFVASPELLLYVIKPLFVMCIVSVLLAVVLLKFQKTKQDALPSISAPFNWSDTFRAVLFIVLILIFVAITKRTIGTAGMLPISFLGGLFEIHGVTLATALLYLNQQLSATSASSVLLIAVLASFVSKFFLLWTLTPRKFAAYISLMLLLILFSGGMTFWLMS